jgi:hypothetical protein
MSTANPSPDLRQRFAAVSSTEITAAIGVGGIAIATLLPAGGIEDGPVLCPFRALTGLPCPGCGLTRSWVYLMHGDVGPALASNWFGPVLILAVIALVVTSVRARSAGKRPADLDKLVRNPIVLGTFALFLTYGAARLILTLAGVVDPV